MITQCLLEAWADAQEIADLTRCPMSIFRWSFGEYDVQIFWGGDDTDFGDRFIAKVYPQPMEDEK